MSFSINGLVSGLDTAQIITDLMKLERLPYTRLETQKSNLQSEQSIFRSINTKLSKLQTAIADLKLSSTFNLTSAKSTDETAVKVTAGEGASAGNFNVVVEQTAKNHTIVSASMKSSDSDLAGQTLKIKTAVGEVEIDVANDATNAEALEYIKNQINNSNSGVSASVMTVNETGDQVLVLTSKETGVDSKFTAKADADTVSNKELGLVGFGVLGLGTDAAINGTVNGTTVKVGTTQAAQNAKFTVNGVAVEKSSNTINGVISGVTLQLLKGGNATSTVTVAPDGDKVAAKIEALVTAYNDVVSSVRDNLAKPSDKTKMNPLQGDSMLKEISNSLNEIFTQIHGTTNTIPGPGDFNPDGTNKNLIQMSQLGLEIDKGITTAALMSGKITFDKEAFKAKLNENPAAIANLFAAKDTGFADKMEKQLKIWTSSVDGLMTSKIKGYDAEIEMVDDRIVAMDNRLLMKEKQLKSQFTAMEVSLTSLKNQQSWLTNQLAALNPKK